MIINGRYFIENLETGEYIEVSKQFYEDREKFMHSFSATIVKKSNIRSGIIQIISTNADNENDFRGDNHWTNIAAKESDRTLRGLYRYFQPFYPQNKTED